MPQNEPSKFSDEFVEEMKVQQYREVYNKAFDSYQAADRTIVYELYLSVATMSLLIGIIERWLNGRFPMIFVLLLGLFTVFLVYFSTRTLEHVKSIATGTMKEIERESFYPDVPRWQKRIDEQITYTAESGDSLGWFRPVLDAGWLNIVVPTGWVGIQFVLLLAWILYALFKLSTF